MIQQFSSPEDLSKGQTAFLPLPINSTEPSHLTFPQTAENHPAHDSSENSPLNPSNNSDHDSDVPKSRSHSTLHSFIVYVFALVTILLVFTIFIVMYFHLHTKNSHLHSNYDLKKPLITFLQLNDLYEILPQQKQGGFEYISTLKRKLEGKYVNCIFAGDLISPSPISTVNYEGSKLNGRQMIDLANDVFDIATLGNHEFDYDAETFRMRILQSKFPWIRSNIEPEGVFVELDTKHVTKSYEIRSFSISDGDVTSTFKELRIAFLGISPAYLKVPYAKVNNIRDTIKLLPNIISEIREKHSPHMIIAITHLNFEDDVELASADLGIDLIMGGHEHENMLAVRGQTDVVITKADSDARSAYIHKVYLFEPDISEDILRSAFPFTPTVLRRDDITIVVDRYLQKISSNMPKDVRIVKKVNEFFLEASKIMSVSNFHLSNEIFVTKKDLDFRKSSRAQFPLSNESLFLADAFLWCGHRFNLSLGAKFSMYTSGLVYIDEILQVHNFSEFDVFLFIPFIDYIVCVKMKGSVLLETLKISVTKNYNSNGFVIWSSTVQCESNFTSCYIGDDLINNEMYYEVFVTSNLISGNVPNLGFLKPSNKGVELLGEQVTKGIPIQRCVVDYLKQK